MLRKSSFRVRVPLYQTVILTPILASRFSSSSSSSSPPPPQPPSLSSSSSPAFAMKNVTRKNFDSSLVGLRAALRDADFVSIDLEMTGVVSAPWRDSFEFDRSDVRYVKVKDSTEKFSVVQFGVCPFRWDNMKETFVAHPHNFYIFPRKELSLDLPSYEFLCQTTSLEFLAKHQFDFNACIHEGISYISRTQEAEVLQRLKLAGDYLSEDCQKGAKHMPLIRTADIFFTERMNLRFKEWRESLIGSQIWSHPCGESSGDSRAQMRTIFFKM